MGALGLDPGKAGVDIKIITDYCLANDVRAIFMDEFQDSVLQLSNQEQLAFLSMLRGMCGPPLYMSFLFLACPRHLMLSALTLSRTAL